MYINSKWFFFIFAQACMLILTYSSSIGTLFAFCLIYLILIISEKYSLINFIIITLIGNLVGISLFISNGFTLGNIKLFILVILYFTMIFELQFISIYVFKDKKYGIFYIFISEIIFNLIITILPKIFPLYFTLGLYKINGLNFITTKILPIFIESIFIVITIELYQWIKRKIIHKQFILTNAFILIISVIISIIVKGYIVSKNNDTDNQINIGIIQESFTKKDYILAEKYEEFAEKIAESYINDLNKITDTELIVLPESSFPVMNNLTNKYISEIKETAINNKQYIISNFKRLNISEKGENMLICYSPTGERQTYTKTYLIPFVETKIFNHGIKSTQFFIKDKLIAPMLCYDSIFLNNYLTNKQADLIIVSSNDVFSDGTGMAALHECITKMYAKLFNKSLLYVSQNYKSFYIDSNGYTEDLTKKFENKIIKICIYI